MKKCHRILTPAFLLASLASYTPADVMFQAAPEYNEPRWNGVLSGNENLLTIYRSYPEAIEKLVQFSHEHSSFPVSDIFPRRTASQIEKTLSLARALPVWIKENGDRERLIQSLSYHLKLEPLRLRYVVLSLEHVAEDMRLQNLANCLVYAVNDPEKKPFENMIPGYRTTGKKYSPFKYDAVENFDRYAQLLIENLESDGAKFAGKRLTYKAGYYNMAFYLKPPVPNARNVYQGYGMHFVRQDRDGGWSHKFSDMNVNRMDFAGNPILDPAKADFNTDVGNYIFIGYLHVPEGGIDIGSPTDPSTKSHSPPAFRL